MSLVFSWEPIDLFLTEGIEDLLVDHWEEVAKDQDLIPFAPDWERYRHNERTGQFKALGCWRDGKLIGYNAFFTFPPYHYCRTPHAMNDIIYIRPEERGEAGIRLILTAERDLFAQGIVKIMYHAKRDLLMATLGVDSLDAIDKLLEIEGDMQVSLADAVAQQKTMGGLLAALGYRHVEDVYDKVRR